MRQVAPRTGATEITIAEDQLEYTPVVGALYQFDDGAIAIVTRWKFTDEERARIAAGEDFYLTQFTFGQPMQPISPSIGEQPWMRIQEQPS